MSRMTSTSPTSPALPFSPVNSGADLTELGEVDSFPAFDVEALARVANGGTITIEGKFSPQQLACMFGQTELWHIAECARCGAETGTDNGEPFADDGERNAWAVEHITATGHVVKLTMETRWWWLADSGLDLALPHQTAMLRLDDGEWRFLCTAKPCERWNGPYEAGHQALASFRAHTAEAA